MPVPQVPFAFCPDGRACLSDRTYGYARVGIFSHSDIRTNPVQIIFVVAWFIIGTANLLFVLGGVALGSFYLYRFFSIRYRQQYEIM